MKADGITLSTVGAGRWLQSVPRAARAEGRRPVLRRRQPREHPRHLPQGDPAGLRPADHRGAVLPDPDVVVADPARARRRPAAAPRLQRHDRQAGRADRARRPPATIRSSPSGSTAWAARWRGRRTRPADGRRTGSPGTGSTGSSRSSSAGRSRATRPSGIEATLRDGRWTDRAPRRERRGRRLATRLLRDARPSWSARTSSPRTSSSSRSRPASTRLRSGEVDPGAYAIRVTQIRPGVIAARADGRAGCPDGRRVPPARAGRGVPRRRCERRPAGRGRDGRSTRGCTT